MLTWVIFYLHFSLDSRQLWEAALQQDCGALGCKNSNTKKDVRRISSILPFDIVCKINFSLI
jgi:hypothetical protein